jgi:hypothetical protein
MLLLKCLPFFWSALVANVTLPVKAPLVVGANAMIADEACPAGSVSGRLRLLIANPAPLNVAWVIVRSVPPLFERLMLLVLLEPTLTFPKATGEGVGESFPTETPFPDADMEAIGCSEVWSVKASVVDGAPGSAGWNWTLNETLCPAGNTVGSARPVT